MHLLDIAERKEVVEWYRRFSFLTISYDCLEDLVQSLHQHSNYPNESGKIKSYRRVSIVYLKLEMKTHLVIVPAQRHNRIPPATSS